MLRRDGSMLAWAATFLIATGLLLVGCDRGRSLPPERTTVLRTQVASSTLVTDAPSPPSAGITYPNPRRYRVSYQVKARNERFEVSRLLVYQPKPVDWDAQENVRILSVEPTPSETRADNAGNGMYSWDLEGLPRKGQTTDFTVKFSLTAHETRVQLDKVDVRPYDTASQMYREYTSAERFIESDDPMIRATADRIANGETDPRILTRRFYDYVIENSTYVRSGKGLRGAKSLLTSGKGECGDYSALFIALSRAAGIPARAVVGYWAVSGLDQSHVWAEFYLPGCGWVPVDPTVGQRPGKHDLYFGRMDNQRVILNKGFNITLLPAAPNNYVAPFLQVPSWWFWGNGPEGSLVVDRASWTVRTLP